MNKKFSPSRSEQYEQKSKNERSVFIRDLGVGALVGALLLGGAKAGETILDVNRYDKAVEAATELHKNLTMEDFFTCKPKSVEVGPLVDADGIKGGKQVPSVRLKAELTPGDQIQSEFMIKGGKIIDGKRLEIAWANQAPFVIAKSRETSKAQENLRVKEARLDNTDETQSRTNSSIYDQLSIQPSGIPIETSYLLPVEVDAEGNTQYDIIPTIRRVSILNTAEKQSFSKTRDIVAQSPCASVVINVSDGQISSVEMAK